MGRGRLEVTANARRPPKPGSLWAAGKHRGRLVRVIWQSDHRLGSGMIRSGGRQRRAAPMADPPDQLVYHLPEPFEQFYEREYHGLVGLGYALTGSWPAAEDLAQEAFLAAHQAWQRISRYEQPGAWVRRVAAKREVSLRRRQLVEARSLLRLAGRRLLGTD